MSVELALLNAVIAKRDFAILVRAGLDDEACFPEQVDAYRFIRRHVDEYGEMPDVTSVIEKCATFERHEASESTETLVAKLHERNVKLEIRRLLEEGAKKFGKSDGYELEEFLYNGLAKVRDRMHARVEDGSVNWAKDVDRRKESYEARARGDYGAAIALLWDEINDAVGGFHRGDDVVVIARTKRGKSWIVDLMAIIANDAGFRVLTEKAESTKDETLFRMDTLKFGINNRGLWAGSLEEEEERTYVRNLEELKREDRPDLIIKTPEDWPNGLTLRQIEADIDLHRPDVVIIDQFSLINFGSDSQRAIREASKQLKLLAARKGVVMVVVAQANGDFMKRQERSHDDDDDSHELKPPSEADYSDTIGIVQDATHVLAFDSVQWPEPDGKQRGKAQIIVRISRTGGAGTSVDLEWCPNEGRIRPRQPMDVF